MQDESSTILTAKEGYDRWSAIYDGEDNPLFVLENEVVEEELGNVSGLRLLELGCGTARWAAEFAAKKAKVTALDQSEGMLARAKEKCRDLEVELKIHNLDLALPFADNTFDRVVSFLVLEHLSDLHLFFSESARVCSSKGFIYVTAMHPAMLLKGVQARFTDPLTGNKIYPKGFPYQTSDYVNAAVKAGLRLEAIGEYASNETHAKLSEKAQKYLGWPLLLTLKFTR